MAKGLDAGVQAREAQVPPKYTNTGHGVPIQPLVTATPESRICLPYTDEGNLDGSRERSFELRRLCASLIAAVLIVIPGKRQVLVISHGKKSDLSVAVKYGTL